MKKRLIILTLICAALFAACSESGNTEINTAINTGSTQTTAPIISNSDETKPETEPIITTFEGAAPEESTEYTKGTENAETDPADGNKDHINLLYGPGMDKISPEDITEDVMYEDGSDWGYVNCDGFAYIAEPTGVCFNTIENPDRFDSVNFKFDPAAPSEAVYKRYKVGDSICGLTISEATTQFINQPICSHDEKYFGGCLVSFDGSTELTGYLIILTDDEYGVGGEGDIIFVPDSKSQTLPVMNYNRASDERGVYSDLTNHCISLTGGFACQSEYPFINCGNISNYGSTMFAAIKENTPTAVKITADNIYMSSRVDWLVRITMQIEDMDIL